jgi:ribosome-binding protein aMBF1 (putative translation factor)
MEVTPEQQQQIQRAKATGESRVNLAFTDQQKADWQRAAREEQDERDATIGQMEKIRDAARQPGFFGDVRRALASSRRPVSELATTIGVEQNVLSDFRAAEAELPAQALETLIAELGLRLMQEIPR